MADPENTREPECCGVSMISYMGGWAWECADAYFALLDEDAIDTIGATPPILKADATAEQREWHRHLLDTRVVSNG